MLDIVVIAPCTGNSLAKLANGITDTPVIMAAKGHLRNLKPVVIAISTNDGLGNNGKNIGMLLNTKNVYFVPFRQDNPFEKPNSIVADMDKIYDTIISALKGQQIQPVLIQ
jgi:dipicolinate synthase subunit B